MIEVAQIGMQLSMVNGVSGVLAAIGHEMLRLEGGVHRLQGQLNALNRTSLAIGGSVALFGGAAGLATVGKLVDHGNSLVKIQRDMAQAGSTAVEIQKAYAESWRLTGKYQNMSAVEIMKMQNDARQTFGSQQLATEHIAPFVEMGAFLKAYEGHEKGGKDAEALRAELNAAMKSGEIAGKINPKDMEEHIRQLTAMKVVYGEQVSIQKYLTAQRNAGVALRNSSDEFRYGMFPALVQENGPNAGVMLMTAFNKVVAGVGNRTKSIERMHELGLLKEDQIEYDKVGRAKGLKDPNAIKNSAEAAMNFGDWVQHTLKPLLEKELDKQGITDPRQRAIRESQIISGIFPDRNAAKAVTEIIQQYTKLSKDAENMVKARKAMNMEEYTTGSWDYQVEAFKTQWDNLLAALGAPLVKTATSALAGVNETLAGMAAWANLNPDTVASLGKGFAILSAALATGGAVALMAALGPAGWIAAGIVALGSYAVLAREKFLSLTQNLSNPFPELTKALTEVWRSMESAIAPHVKAVAGWLKSLSSIDLSGLAAFAKSVAKLIDQGLAAALRVLHVILPPIISLIGQGLSAAMRGLQGILPPIIKHVEGFTKCLSEVAGIAWNVIKIGFEGLVNLLRIMPQIISDVVSALGRLKDALVAFVSGIWEKIKSFFGAGVSKTSYEDEGGFNPAHVVKSAYQPGNDNEPVFGGRSMARHFGGESAAPHPAAQATPRPAGQATPHTPGSAATPGAWRPGGIGASPAVRALPFTGAGSTVETAFAGEGFNTRGVKNMNPGNIAWGPWAAAHGAIGAAGTDTAPNGSGRHGVAVFPSFQAGADALANLALSKYDAGRRSVVDIIAASGGWTPGNMQAAMNVARMMGIHPHADAKLHDPEMMRKFRDALMVQELGPAGARHVRQHLDPAPRPELRKVSPPTRQSSQPVIINTELKLDGRKLAQATTKHVARMHEHSRQSPFFNGSDMFTGPDAQFAVG